MRRRDFAQKLTLGAAGIGLLPRARAAKEAGRRPADGPNVLFVWTDEQIFGMLSCEGNAHIRTPHLDRLASEGVMFTNCFCTWPSCSPSRATVITGAYAFNHRLVDNIHDDRGFEGLKPFDGYKITGQHLQEAGYAIGHQGKWHIGPKKDWGACFTADPDYSETYCPTWIKHRKAEILATYPWDDKTKTGKGGYVKGKTLLPTKLTPSWQKVFGTKGHPNWAIVGQTLVPPEKTMEHSIVEDTIRFIESHKDGPPWMTTLSLSPPHDPWSVPEPYYSDIAKPLMEKLMVEGKSAADEQRSSLSWRVGQLVDDQGIVDYMAIYHAQVKMMDDFIGRVLAVLDEHDLTQNTLVVFTSDHGDMVGLHRNVGKINNNLYNRLFHTPCLIRYPDAIRGGQVVDKPVMHTDFLPTILDYAGIALPTNIDGRSLRPLMEGSPVAWRDYHLLEKHMNVLRNPDHSIRNYDDFYWAMGLEDGRYKYIYTRWNHPQRNRKYCGPRFIDLQNDPHEETNLFEHPDYREQVRAYHRKLYQVLRQSRFPHIVEYDSDPWSTRG